MSSVVDKIFALRHEYESPESRVAQGDAFKPFGDMPAQFLAQAAADARGAALTQPATVWKDSNDFMRSLVDERMPSSEKRRDGGLLSIVASTPSFGNFMAPTTAQRLTAGLGASLPGRLLGPMRSQTVVMTDGGKPTTPGENAFLLTRRFIDQGSSDPAFSSYTHEMKLPIGDIAFVQQISPEKFHQRMQIREVPSFGYVVFGAGSLNRLFRESSALTPHIVSAQDLQTIFHREGPITGVRPVSTTMGKPMLMVESCFYGYTSTTNIWLAHSDAVRATDQLYLLLVCRTRGQEDEQREQSLRGKLTRVGLTRDDAAHPRAKSSTIRGREADSSSSVQRVFGTGLSARDYHRSRHSAAAALPFHAAQTAGSAVGVGGADRFGNPFGDDSAAATEGDSKHDGSVYWRLEPYVSTTGTVPPSCMWRGTDWVGSFFYIGTAIDTDSPAQGDIGIQKQQKSRAQRLMYGHKTHIDNELEHMVSYRNGLPILRVNVSSRA